MDHRGRFIRPGEPRERSVPAFKGIRAASPDDRKSDSDENINETSDENMRMERFNIHDS